MAARTLARRPLFAVLVIATLSLGVGADAAVFALLDSILLEPLPYEDADQLVEVAFTIPSQGLDHIGQSQATYLVFREHGQSYAAFALADPAAVAYTSDEAPVWVQGALVTSGIMPLLGTSIQLGRGLEPADELPDAEPVVVLSNGFWRQWAGASAAAVGTLIDLDGVRTRIVGVLPPQVRFPRDDTELWIPLTIDPARPDPRNFTLEGYARLAAGVSVEAARADADRLLRSLDEYIPGIAPPQLLQRGLIQPLITPLRDKLLGNVGPVLWILFGTVGLVLTIAVANVANLFLARAVDRRSEIALRIALGSSRGRVARLLMTESALVVAVSVVLGLSLAGAGLAALVRARLANLPRLETVAIDATTVVFALVLGLLLTVALGLLPLLQRGLEDLAAGLRGAGRSLAGTRRANRLRAGLVVAQVAVALVLMVGAGLLTRSLDAVAQISPGFQPDGRVALRVAPPPAKYADVLALEAFYDQLLARASAIPGVVSAAVVNNLPLRDGRISHTGFVEEVPNEPGDLPDTWLTKVVSADYFGAMGIALIAGRGFSRADIEDRSDAVVLSRSLAARYWDDGKAIGKRVSHGDTGPWHTVIGVADDVRDRSLTEEPIDTIYYPLVGSEGADGISARAMSLVVHAVGPSRTVAEALPGAVWAVDPTLPVAQVRTLAQTLRDASAATRTAMTLLATAAAIAVLLATVGLYGLIAYLVSQRTREIGIRLALGARASEVRKMVAREGAWMGALGVAIGLVVAFVATRSLRSVLVQISPTDPLTFAAVGALLLGVALAAGAVPASHAARTDPARTLRED